MKRGNFSIALWLWAFAALVAGLALPARAADFTQGVDAASGGTTIWFKSNVATTWVDVHYQVNGGGQQNLRMTYAPAQSRYEQGVSATNGATLSYFFTYNNGGVAFDSPRQSITVGGTVTPPPPPPPPPLASGAICFFEHTNYGGASFCADADSAWVGTVWNDRVSSVRVSAGYRLNLYDDINFGGRTIALTADAPDLVALGFNDIASSFRIGRSTVTVPTSDTPDFGPNVTIFDPATPTTTIQARVDAAFSSQLRTASAQFGDQRFVFLFKPGSYGRFFANLGFYTTLAGLGKNPDDVSAQADLNVDSGWNLGDEKNATQNFWRSAENMAITPASGTNRWAVSQAAPFRRMHVRGNLTLAPSNQDNGQGYSSGGYMADSRVDGRISSGSQQQWYTRDSSIAGWDGGVWNMVFSGVQGAPAQGFPTINKHTVLGSTPVSREKPYLYFEGGKYFVFVPSLRTNAVGASWPNTPGTAIPMSRFFVARPSDSAATMNAALAQGLNLFFTPGVYHLNQTLNVTRADTVVTGIGFPTLVPDGGVNAMTVADVDGVKISNLLFDAGTVNSPVLLTIGSAGAHANHAANPISVQDVFFRIGGAVAGKSTTSLVVHSDQTLIDHIWAWRADHGNSPTGWAINTADTGVIVNGNDVLATGLFVEHYQKFNVIWNGNGGRTIFYQNEMPYDPPSQAAWRSDARGYAAYKVADSVTSHEAWGLGSYCFFNITPSIHADRGFEVPNVAGVRLHSVLTVSLGGVGVIDHVVNNTGAAAEGVSTIPVSLVNYP
jgi:Peptidase inhibitor family I36